VFPDLEELPLGGTAVGTGLNAHPDFARRTIAEIARTTGIPFREAENRFEAMGAQDPLVAASGATKGIAAALMKIAHDLRLLSSGPRCGIGEIDLPPLQPGSSIMPGKVNPVVLEVTIQAAAQAIGNDAVSLLSAVASLTADRCVAGIEPNRKRCAELVEQSLAMITPLAVKIGYNRAAELAHEAYHTGRTIRELLAEKGVLSADEIATVLDPRKMI
jgi:fumarate hydratase class II